jgi:L-cysteate sulfo-lyase
VTPAITREHTQEILAGLPRRRLAHLPTPLEPLTTLSERFGVNLWIKRDDQTGLALGGNKARKLEFLLADVLEQGADVVVTWAGMQSNWCRQLAAGACKLGIRPILLLFRRRGLPSGFDGNFLIDFISGAEIHIIDLPHGGSIMELEGVKKHVAKVVDRERKAGRKAYVAPIGASLVEGSMARPLGALSYVNAFLELLDQFQAQNLDPGSLVFATGSGSMQAGLLVGAKLLSPHLRVLGISVSDDSATMSRYVESIAQQTIREFVFNRPVNTSEVIVLDSYMGEGYGILDRSTAEAIRQMAEAEGVILDPVYSGRAWAALVDLIGQGYFHAGETIVFLHTGGTPALFPYREDFRAFLRANPKSADL